MASQETYSENRHHGRFSMEEDARLLEYVSKHGAKRWRDVAIYVGTRDSKQCRERYFGHLAPQVNKEPFTEKEIDEIYRLFEEGCKWAAIAKRLGNGRIPNNIKNTWNQKLSKTQRGERIIKKKREDSSVKNKVKARPLLSSQGKTLEIFSISSDDDDKFIKKLPDIQLSFLNHREKLSATPFPPLKPLERIPTNIQYNIQLPPISPRMRIY
ncbi:1865_t:CDS:2 [Acaulospora morrowiae]|uniref:1865_t:CDS:1 n=1 Tax=Acaulospora morrowiae TaxID=94023 RepID=A0A9N8V977_9GLOM|nr:1865_t:CDS:2 [Acaulospora morrowiae]